MDINLLVKVTSRAWSISILSLMYKGTAGRQAPLLAASGAGRTAFVQSLTHLTDLGLVERNPGYGHPLRPEFRLTAKGVELAGMAEKIEGAVVKFPTQQAILRRAWAVPILAVSQKPRFFSEIKGDLGTVTDRALSQSLQQLQTNRLIRREVNVDLSPPRAIYQACDLGFEIAQAVNVKTP